ncbi:MAG: chromosome segregation protein SMC [Planctomycetes bacterium]|nr:chromosome segregation protein SMC [Planctomycetota bacterium]
MRLQRIELFGFKSFADRTTLNFYDSLTGIVGPNGCGKSNVVDAVRWVLGETRPTSMRGGEMSDVIFKGSVSRPPMNVAEVTLVLDNTCGTIAQQGLEVAITRRVYRSGEGEYLINGERARLKDVRDMLFDTGLGSRGYAVLEQGKIDAALSANSLDRRAIFEEAAGISRYKVKRKETDAKLKRVEGDLMRLDDVLKELGSRVRSLKIQAGKAERFVAARELWKGRRSRYLKHRLHEGRSALAGLSEQISALEARCEQLKSLRADGEADVSAREREQETISAEIDRLSGEIRRLVGEDSESAERQRQLESRAADLRRSSEGEARRALELGGVVQTRGIEIADVRARAAAIEEQLSQSRSAADGEQVTLRETRNTQRELRASCERQNQLVLSHLNERTAAQNLERTIELSRPSLSERLQRAQLRMEESGREVEVLQGDQAAAEGRVIDGQNDLAVAETSLHDLQAGQQALEREEQERRATRSKHEVERARISSRIDTLKDMEHERSSLEAGARALLEGTRRGQGPCEPEQLKGLVADHLRTSTRLARALDAALGPAALGLVTLGPDLAGRMLRWLSERKCGQVRVYVPSGIGAREQTKRDAALAAFPRLLDEVECSVGFEPLAALLVGDVLVVEELELALALVREHPQWRFVTPEGDLVSVAGVFGGHREVTQGAVGRRSTAAEFARELEAIEKAIREETVELERLAGERRVVAERRAHAQSECDRRRQQLTDARAQVQTAKARLADLSRVAGQLTREHEAILADERRLDSELEGTQKRHATAQANFARENERLATLDAERVALEARLETLQSSASSAESVVIRQNAELGTLHTRVRDLDRGLSEARAELERSERLSREQAEAADAAVSEAARVRTRGDEVLVERAAADSRFKELREAEVAGREAVSVFRARVDAVTRELESLASELSERRMDAQKIELVAAELVVRTREDLGIGEVELLHGFEPEERFAEEGALDALEQEVAELKRGLDAIGPVNTDAVAELSESQTRLDFLTGQRRDIEESRKVLADALAHLNIESQRLFEQTFEEVRKHFNDLFRQLFQGGKADLAIEQGVDPLEAGVEISARPPGREMLPIRMLSGGQRTMTALALLFAVFRSRPSPFCVLDEVDAALDESNVGRFLGMISTFRTQSQFVVVTHNKGTMGACDRLYGITMETKGVSSWVSVQFQDVEKFVPEITSGVAATAADEVPERAPRVVAVDDEPLPEYMLVPPAAASIAAEVAPEVAPEGVFDAEVARPQA